VARVGAEQPDTAEAGSTLVEFSFTTGSELLDPLALLGELEVETEVFEEPVYDPNCVVPCGGGISCEPTGTRSALRALITVPALSGGNTALGYYGWLSYSMNEATVFDGPGEGEVPASSEVNLSQGFQAVPGEPTRLQMRLVGEGAPYAPCFAANAWDSGGQHVTASHCLEPLDIEALEAEAERQRTEADAGAVAEPSQPPDDTDGTDETDDDTDGGADDVATDDDAVLDDDPSDDSESPPADMTASDVVAPSDMDPVDDAGSPPRGTDDGKLGEPSKRAASDAGSSGCAYTSSSPAAPEPFALLAVVVGLGALRRRRGAAPKSRALTPGKPRAPRPRRHNP
jgi:MYXO-CTERM domain-containing protein